MMGQTVRLLITLMFFIAAPSAAKPKFAAPLLEFKLEPNICIAREVGDSCEMTAHIVWQLTDSNDVCLWQNQQVIKCWQQQSQVAERLSIRLEQESMFRLVEHPSERVLAEHKVKINYQVNQRYRRRLRAEWSIF